MSPLAGARSPAITLGEPVTNAVIDLTELVRKLASRTPTRTEATIQGQLHALLLAAPLQLDEAHLNDIVLEQPAGQRRRIDVEVGLCVFEVKRDLRTGTVRADGEVQLAGYVVQRTAQQEQRYVGVLTDGCDWHLYRLQQNQLVHVSSITLTGAPADVDTLCVWLEGVLAIGEELVPTPSEIAKLLGAGSPGYLLDMAELTELYQLEKSQDSVQVRRQLWAKLLTTALGTAFRDDDTLFVQHTLLVVCAEIIAHAVLDIDPRAVTPAALVSGQQFRSARVRGVVEADFFDWLIDVPGGERFVRGLARRLSRFAWANVEHDVLKVLYESVIPAEQRKQMGEYYTPDWLAQRVVEEVIAHPLGTRVLDPSCGSGTFVFYAVRRYLTAADGAHISNSDALAGVCTHVMGMDLHPVAVTLARVTYLLAIGTERLNAHRGPISIPVFLGDSLQWREQDTLQAHGAFVVTTDDVPQLIPSELRFPDSVVADATRFDGLVAELAEKASNRKRGSAPPSVDQIFRRYAVLDEDRPGILTTFNVMCSLHDQRRDHIWGYYIRNLTRPRWLRREANNVDVLIGNPPWLSYRFMTPRMQQDFQRMSKERKLWAGAKSAPHLDLSALFVVRCIEGYLRKNGTFAFVMPLAVLSRPQYVGFRTGKWPRGEGGLIVGAAFFTPWDLHAVKPPFFEVPCSVVLGVRTENAYSALPMPTVADAWSGRLPKANVTMAVAMEHLTTKKETIHLASTKKPGSPYAARFSQGATLVPRVLCFVEELPSGPLGHATGEVRVHSRRSALEKKPWKTLPALEATIENNFLFPVHVGDTVLPFRLKEPLRGVIPWDGRQLLHGGDDRIGRHPGLSDWWTQAEAVWEKNRSSERLALIERWDFQHGLSGQFLLEGGMPEIRVLYASSGMYIAAAMLTDSSTVIDNGLYWAACATEAEAQYLCAVLNSTAATLAVRRYQARGEHNPRHIHKYVWQLRIPEFDAADPQHSRLSELGFTATELVARLELPSTRFEKQRRFVREYLAATETGVALEAAVSELLAV